MVDIEVITGVKESKAREVLAEIVDLHISAFPGFFLTSLGPRFLSLLYTEFMTQPKGLLVRATENGALAGFAAGTTDPSNFFKDIRRRKSLPFFFAMIPGFAKRPVFVLKKCWVSVFYRGEVPRGYDGAALLSSLAVSPNVQGKGLGRILVKTFTEEVAMHNGKVVFLTTDERNNDKVNRFYQGCGFVLHDTIVKPGPRVMNRWAMYI